MAVKLTNRKPNKGANKVSHSKRRTNSVQNLNKQTKVVDGTKITLTTREWRTMKKAA